MKGLQVGRSCLLAAVLLSTGLPLAGAQQYRPGDQVVVIRDGELRVENKKVDDVWAGLTLKVGAVNGNYLWLSNGKPGWLNRSQVMPLNRAAIDQLTSLIQSNPRDARLYSGRSLVWKALGDLEIALGDLNEAIRLSPSSENYNTRGNVWHKKREYDRAIADFNEALRLDPKNDVAYSNRGFAWHNKREYDRAIADYNEAIRLDPKNAIRYNNRGWAWHNKHQYDKAIGDYTEALRIDPKYSWGTINMALLFATASNENFRDAEKAIRHADAALVTDPKHAYALSAKACALAIKGDFEKAIELQNEALADADYATDKNIDGGAHAPARIERWKAKTLWLDDMAQ